MNTHAHPSLHLLRAAAVAVLFAAPAVLASPPTQVKVVASQRRNDLTAGGSSQRIGVLRQQQRTQRLIEKQAQAAESKKK